MDELYTCVYTKQKTQKRKKWLDGVVKVTGNSKLILYDGGDAEPQHVVSTSSLDQHRLVNGMPVIGLHEFEKYLVDIDAILSPGLSNADPNRFNKQAFENKQTKNSVFRAPWKSSQPMQSIMKPLQLQRKSVSISKHSSHPLTTQDLLALFEKGEPSKQSNILFTATKPSHFKSNVTPSFRPDQKSNACAVLKTTESDIFNIPCSENLSNLKLNTTPSFLSDINPNFKPPNHQKSNKFVRVASMTPTSESDILGQLRFAEVSTRKLTNMRCHAKSCASSQIALSEYHSDFTNGLVDEMQWVLNRFSADFFKASKRPGFEGSIFRSQQKRKRDETLNSETKYFLHSKHLQSDIRKKLKLGDVWLISTSPICRQNANNVWLFRSVWHGASSEGKIQLVPVSSNFKSRSISNVWTKQTKIFWQNGPNLDHFFSMASTVFKTSLTNPPVMNFLLPAVAGKIPSIEDRIPNTEVEDALKLDDRALQLNVDQQAVWKDVYNWICENPIATNPVLLVHGVYGSGKTYCISTIIASILQSDAPVKICVAASTNIAVDNVLKGLLGLGVNNFFRIGSLKAVDAEILDFVLHQSESDQDLGQVLTEAKSCLRDHPSDQAKRVLARLEAEGVTGTRHRQEALMKSAKVVGVTCCSSSKQVMAGIFGDPDIKTICILGKLDAYFRAKYSIDVDECSQMIEPQSLLPIVHCNASYLLLVGDPKQLPPVTGCLSSPLGISTPLFQRLVSLKVPLRMLTTQYRCHRYISDVASKLFYDSQVKTGDIDRRMIIPGFKTPMTFVDVPHSAEERAWGASFINQGEKCFIVKFVDSLLKYGISADRVCVIAMYRAQAHEIKKALDFNPQAASVVVATVDAFQGAERDIVLVSCCRSTDPGFTVCPMRANVMITRAKNHVVFFGNSAALSTSRLWRNLIGHSERCFNFDSVLDSLLIIQVDS